MAPTREQVARARENAQRSYQEVRDFYEQMERECPAGFSKLARKDGKSTNARVCWGIQPGLW